MMKFISTLTTLLLLIFCGCGNTKQNELSLENIKEASLKECLDINYSKLGLYNKAGLNDKSYLYVWFGIDNKSTKKSKDLKRYIRSEVGDFYLSKPSVKNSDSNMILILCMRFYNSEELSDYISNGVLK
ncbi:hypothetical protein AB1D72_004398 [Salmonella enterica subsp. enterica serovar Carswell]|nr:hypothetical protein [Salmonella enterica]EKA9975880.1 hypothetical protein [Salmonella enterica subsp. enterica]